MDDKPAKSVSNRWKTWGIPFGLTLIILGLSPWLLPPKMPKQVAIATGSTAGNYYQVGLKYQDILSEQGVELDVQSTAGSINNLDLLHSGDADIAIVQSGLTEAEQHPDYQAIASLYLEPIWLFHRAELNLEQLSDLAGKTVSIGAEGSGTIAVAHELLAANQLNPNDQIKCRTLSSEDSVKALIQGEIDAAFFVQSPQSSIIQQLIASDEVNLFEFKRAQAYSQRLRYLKPITLPEGILDLNANLPHRDLTLMATHATLVVKNDINSALVLLLLNAAHEVHGPGGLLESPGDYPSRWHVDFPLNQHAKHHFEHGPSFLFRIFPFSIAAWLDRMKLLLLPLITLLYPLSKALPPLNRFRIRYKIFRWYGVLREIDEMIACHCTQKQIQKDLHRLKEIDNELANVSVPLSYMEEFYNLRLHIDLVQKRLEQMQETDIPEAAQTLKSAA